MTRSAEGRIYEFDGFSLDPAQRQLTSRDGRSIKLTPRVFDTLLCFVEHPGQLLDKATLMRAVWPDTVVEDNNLTQAITALRKALGDTPGDHRFIATDPGRGYRFVMDVRDRDATAESEAGSETMTRRVRWPMPVAVAGVLTLAVAYLLVQLLRTNGEPDTTTAIAQESIAVLPFVNLSPDPEQDYFSDGIATELLNRLARIPDLRVAGRTSSFAFRGRNESLRTIGERLNVAHILEGSVRKAGNRVRIAVQLVQASDGYQLWSATFDRQLTDIFEIQDEIAQAVAAALSITLGVGEGNLDSGGTRNFEAYDAYLKGIAFSWYFDIDGTTRAIEKFEQAVELDPDYARAWSTLARTYWLGANLFLEGRTEELYQKSEIAASRAMAIAPDSVASLLASAQLRSRKRDWLGAELELRKALALAPTDYQANLQHGLFCLDVGRPKQAIANFQQAVRTEPLLLEPTFRLGNAYEFSGRLDLAREQFERGRDLLGNQAIRQLLVLVLAMEEGDRARLEENLHAVIAMEGGLPDDAQRMNRTMASLLDHPEVALEELQGFASDPAFEFPMSRSAIGTWAAFFRDPDLALESYRKLYEITEISLYLIWQPILAPMRALPGFKDLVRGEGLVDYWRSSGKWGEFCRPLGDDDFVCR